MRLQATEGTTDIHFVETSIDGITYRTREEKNCKKD